MKTLIIEKDLPSSLTITIIPSPQSKLPQNILLLLHGLGDNHNPFATLARQMQLPETLAIAILAPSPLPAMFAPGGPGPHNHWCDDVLFDPSPSGPPVELDAGFGRARGMLVDELVGRGLRGECGVREREVMWFGFGQGGMAALDAAVAVEVAAAEKEKGGGGGADTSASGNAEMSGVITIGGPLSSSTFHYFHASELRRSGKKCRTPVLICGGNRESAVTSEKIKRLKEVFESVEVVKWDRKGDGMMKSREEMMPIMRFLGKRLRSRAGVPEGSVEV